MEATKVVGAKRLLALPAYFLRENWHDTDSKSSWRDCGEPVGMGEIGQGWS